MLADDELGRRRERPGEPPDPSYVRAFDAIDQDPNQKLLVLDHDGEVIGTLQLTFVPGLSHLGGLRLQVEAVRIDQRFRDRGLGRLIFEWVIDHARRTGCRMVQLTTNKSRPDAHRFYERLGFVASHHGMKLTLT